MKQYYLTGKDVEDMDRNGTWPWKKLKPYWEHDRNAAFRLGPGHLDNIIDDLLEIIKQQEKTITQLKQEKNKK